MEPESLDLGSVSGARSALSILDDRLTKLSSEAARQGAFESRLNVAKNVLQVSVENYAAADSRIKDVDVAEESARLLKEKILQQVGAAILSQANNSPQIVLSLLRN